MSAQSVAASLTRLQPFEKQPPSLASGQFLLAKDDRWDSTTVTMDTSSFGSYDRQPISNRVSGQATLVAFNLPVGIVVTLCENQGDKKGGANLSKCGRTIDLVGTGKTESTNLKTYNVNDCLKLWFWRNIDFSLGAVEVFDNSNFTGNMVTIFLAEWNLNETININNWYLNDKISSARWKGLQDRQSMYFYADSDAKGNEYSFMTAWNKTREEPHMKDYGKNDTFSSFVRKGAIPVREEIAMFDLTVPKSQSTFAGVVAEKEWDNDGDQIQEDTINLVAEESQSVTVSTEDTYTTGVETTVEQKIITEADAAVAKSASELTWSVTVKFEYTRKEAVSKTTTQTTTMGSSQLVRVSPRSIAYIKLYGTICKVPISKVTVDVMRWYKEAISGGELDPASNLYKRKEKTTLNLEGTLGYKGKVQVKEVPISQAK